MGNLIFKAVTVMMNKIPLGTLIIKDTHDWSIDKPYECGLEILERGFFAKKRLSLFYANQKAIIFLFCMANLLFILLFGQHCLSYYIPYYDIHLQKSEILSY